MTTGCHKGKVSTVEEFWEMPGLIDFFTIRLLMGLHARWISRRIPGPLPLHPPMWVLFGTRFMNHYFKATSNTNLSKPVSLPTRDIFLGVPIRNAALESFTLYCCLMVGWFCMMKVRLLLYVSSTHQVFLSPWVCSLGFSLLDISLLCTFSYWSTSVCSWNIVQFAWSS